MDGNDALDHLLGDRLNQEPVVFRGYTDSELSLAIRTACLTFLPLGALIGLLFGNFGMGLALALINILASVFFGGRLVQRLKRNRPEFDLQQRAHLALAGRGLVRCEFGFQGERKAFRRTDGSCQMDLGRDEWRRDFGR